MYANNNNFTNSRLQSAIAIQAQHANRGIYGQYNSTLETSNSIDLLGNSNHVVRDTENLLRGTSLKYMSPQSYSPPSQISERMYSNRVYEAGMHPSFAENNSIYNHSVINREPLRRQSPEMIGLSYSSTLPSEASHYNTYRMSLPGPQHPRPARRPPNRDEFDGVNQYLPPLSPAYIAAQDRDIPHLPTNLVAQEQDEILSMVTLRLSRCAYDFVAKYEFPIPVDNKLRPVTRPEDREWTEWVYLLKRLATKRRIPARLLYQGQIKQLVTILENSLEMRCVSRVGSRPLRDDRNVLQLVSAGIQVAKILKDAPAVEDLDALYIDTDTKIATRMGRNGRAFR